MTIDHILKTSRPLYLLAAVVTALAVAACTGDSPDYCTDDSTCQDSTREEYDPAKPHCHGEGHFCFAGCNTDADCKDTSKSWYEADKPICHPGTRDCVAKKPDVDMGPDAGDALVPDQTPPVEAGVDASDVGIDTVDAVVPDTGIPTGKKCVTGGAPCQSGFCVDGYCCDKKCDGVCESCKEAGKEGTCTPHPVDKDPESGCSGSVKCGNDACDGKGKCKAALPATTVCDTACKTGDLYTLQENFCDGVNGSCLATAKDTACKPYKCTGAAGAAACATDCTSHTDCHADSLCDRSAAHQTGKGVCAKAADVLKVGSTQTHTTVQAGVTAALAAKKKYVKVAAGTYKEKLSITAGEVVIVGDGLPVIEAGSGNTPAISISGGAKVTLQGVKVQGALGGDKADGATCSGATKTSTLVVLESTITDNSGQGVEASYCDVTLRRNTIQSNKGGGAKLSDGTFVIVNNVVVKNGEVGSALGGFQLSPGSGKVTFMNNTVADNVAKSKDASGLICFGMTEVISNSIVWNSLFGSNDKVYQSCKFEYSDVQGGVPTGTGNLSQDPKFDTTYKLGSTSPCIDKGSSTGVSKIDISGGSRTKGKGTDMGAYEVQ